MKLLKLFFQDRAKWKLTEPNLYLDYGTEEQRYIDNVVDIRSLGFLQKPPPEDWIPENEEDNGWYLSSNYSVDVLVEDNFDYSPFETYILGIPKDTKFLHKYVGVHYPAIIDTGKLSANTKAELQLTCRTWGISYNAGDTKAVLIQKIEDNIQNIIGNG